jgi:hypothetical protein
VVLETNNQEQLIFKHAISTVAMGRTSHGPTGVTSASTSNAEVATLPGLTGTEV